MGIQCYFYFYLFYVWLERGLNPEPRNEIMESGAWRKKEKGTLYDKKEMA